MTRIRIELVYILLPLSQRTNNSIKAGGGEHYAWVGNLRAHDVAQLLQVGWGEIPVVPVTALNVLVNAV